MDFTDWTLERRHRDGCLEKVSLDLPGMTDESEILVALREADGDIYDDDSWFEEFEENFQGHALYHGDQFVRFLTDEEALP